MFGVGLKYIIFDGILPVIFTSAIRHDEVCHGRKPTSAGFINLTPVETMEGPRISVKCYGESVSLGIPSHSEKDEKIIDNHFNQY